MRYSTNWKDYALLDCSDGERLERWGKAILIRPDPQVIWQSPRRDPRWREAHARYIRSSSGGGRWEAFRPLPEPWEIAYGALRFSLKLMGFKHTGLFPEQAVNWDFLTSRLANKETAPRVLNLFAYTGGATLACLAVGAHVTHVDASRGMVQRARDNAALSGLLGRPLRWIVEDCAKFIQREIRRGSQYDVILLDPPSYGRGPGGEVWQLADELFGFLGLCGQLLRPDDPLLLLNAYSAEFSPAVIEYLLSQALGGLGGTAHCEEIGLRVESSGLVLPCGSTAVFSKQSIL